MPILWCVLMVVFVANMLLMQCSAVSVECLLVYPCCVVLCGMLSVMVRAFSLVFWLYLRNWSV